MFLTLYSHLKRMMPIFYSSISCMMKFKKKRFKYNTNWHFLAEIDPFKENKKTKKKSKFSSTSSTMKLKLNLLI